MGAQQKQQMQRATQVVWHQAQKGDSSLPHHHCQADVERRTHMYRYHTAKVCSSAVVNLATSTIRMPSKRRDSQWAAKSTRDPMAPETSTPPPSTPALCDASCCMHKSIGASQARSCMAQMLRQPDCRASCRQSKACHSSPHTTLQALDARCEFPMALSLDNHFVQLDWAQVQQYTCLHPKATKGGANHGRLQLHRAQDRSRVRHI